MANCRYLLKQKDMAEILGILGVELVNETLCLKGLAFFSVLESFKIVYGINDDQVKIMRDNWGKHF